MFLAAFLLHTVVACSPGVVEPSADLTGVWQYSYSTEAARACAPPAPPDHTPGCAGGGEARLTHTGEQISGSIAFSGYCQSCGSVADSFGISRPVTGQLRGNRLEFTTGGCAHTATVPGSEISELSGTVTCTLGTVRTEGTWRLMRKS